MLEIKSVSKKYGKTPALSDISLAIDKGEIIGLFGENGAGKSTLMKCILGFVKYSGEITLDSQPVTNANIARFSFATSEHSFFPYIDANAHKAFYAQHFERFNEKRFDALIDFFDLPRNKQIRKFSSGQQNQFEVVCALSQGADYILMDEPFAGNDIFNREDFYKVLLGILEPEETVILSTHLIEEVSNFISRAVLIKGGNLIADKSMDNLEEDGTDLVSFIKQTYDYAPGRISKILADLSPDEI